MKNIKNSKLNFKTNTGDFIHDSQKIIKIIDDEDDLIDVKN